MLGLLEKDVFRSALNWIENLERLISFPQVTELKSGTRILSLELFLWYCSASFLTINMYIIHWPKSSLKCTQWMKGGQLRSWFGRDQCQFVTTTLKSLGDQNVWGKRYIWMSFLSGSMTSTGYIRGIWWVLTDLIQKRGVTILNFFYRRERNKTLNF